jgi:hypothetical protein
LILPKITFQKKKKKKKKKVIKQKNKML